MNNTVSIVIPSYKDPFLQKTIDSLLENAQGEIEIIPILDGYIPETPIKSDSRVKVIKFPENCGMRAAINAGIKAAHGKFIMKCDSHCLFGPGYDKIMTENCAKNWLMIPRRYSLDENNWQRNKGMPFRDYHYLNFPVKSRIYGTCLVNQDWNRRTRERMDPKYDIDDTMIFQGSCWLANKKHFMKQVGFLDDRKEAYGPFGGEQLEVGLKYWLGGGKIKVIKKTWYAHLFKKNRHYQNGLFSRAYKFNRGMIRARTWTTQHWLNNEEPNMIHPFSWLVEKFWPVPSWPEDKSLWVFPK
jgi:glycosyltransferase involved in cell wall biosynthesis